MSEYRTELENYRQLAARVDELCRRIATEFAGSLACREGCCDCCRHITLFPVEARALACALGALSVHESRHILSRARTTANSKACPLLENGRCLLYAARPLICRTHGLPILNGRGKKRKIDFCPKNFIGVPSIPASFILDLEILNTTLAAINAVFLASYRGQAGPAKERLSIAEALQMKIKD
ncbi:MAG TPA: YkgJ family cysteine cluster protein [Geobacteraceae bacterium]|nr:YkgJ family cysteine cluster protein [Geobacteraceae bacterium]